jgi:hypothetical protein
MNKLALIISLAAIAIRWEPPDQPPESIKGYEVRVQGGAGTTTNFTTATRWTGHLPAGMYQLSVVTVGTNSMLAAPVSTEWFQVQQQKRTTLYLDGAHEPGGPWTQVGELELPWEDVGQFFRIRVRVD